MPKHINIDQLNALEEISEQNKIWQEGLEKNSLATTINHQERSHLLLLDARDLALGAQSEGVNQIHED